MIDLPNRCEVCKEKTFNGCDIYYSMNGDARKGVAQAHEIGLSYGVNPSQCLEQNSIGQEKLNIDLIETLGKAGCQLSPQQIRENIEKTKAY